MGPIKWFDASLSSNYIFTALLYTAELLFLLYAVLTHRKLEGKTSYLLHSSFFGLFWLDIYSCTSNLFNQFSKMFIGSSYYWISTNLTHHPSNQPFNQPTNQPSNQPTNHSTNEPTIQPTNRPINQPTNHSRVYRNGSVVICVCLSWCFINRKQLGMFPIIRIDPSVNNWTSFF